MKTTPVAVKSNLLQDNKCQLLYLPQYVNFRFATRVSLMLRGHESSYGFWCKDIFILLATGEGTCPHIKNIRTGDEVYLVSTAFYEQVQSLIPLTIDSEGRVIVSF